MVNFDINKGFAVQSASEIRAKLAADFRRVFDDETATLNTEPESPAGQLIDSITALIVAKDTELLNLFNQFNPMIADGLCQDALGKIYFLDRKQAEPTIVVCQCHGLQGTQIPKGAIIQNTDGIFLQSMETAIITETGAVDVEFSTQETGAVAIGAGTCTKIVTVIPHWDSVNNAVAGAIGRDIETRAEFELRRYKSVAANAHGSVVALYGTIAGLNGVLDCLVLENKTDEIETKQGVELKPHSVAVCAFGGADDEIAKAIYNKLDAGCDTSGNVSIVHNEADGTVNRYKIVRPTPTNIYITVEINKTATTQSTISDDVKRAIIADFYGANADTGNARCGLGQTIYASRFSVAVIKTAKVNDLVGIKIGFAENPQAAHIVTDANVEPILDEANISVILNE